MPDLKLSIGTFLFGGPETLRPALEAIQSAGIAEIDTAQMYGTNEADLGAAGAAAMGFALSTKNWGGWKKGEALQPESLRRTTLESVEKLGLKLIVPGTDDDDNSKNKNGKIDIFYVHGPDRTIPVSTWAPVLDQLHRQGAFARLGVSNFRPAEVRELHAYCAEHGLVRPTVYQGNYNALSRRIERDLFPVLRELGIAFYAYSPVAGGFLTKTRAALEGEGEGEGEGGRFAPVAGAKLNDMYRALYLKPAMLGAVDRWGQLAAEQGVPRAELAYRWVYHHSALRPDERGDHVILGASKVAQVAQTVEGLRRGPLKPEVVRGIDEMWECIKDDAIVDNFDATQT